MNPPFPRLSCHWSSRPSFFYRRSASTGYMRRSLAAIFILVFLLLAIDTAPASALPPDFEDTLIAVINAPTDLEWTPDGRVLVTEKHGQLWVVQNGSVVSPPAIDLADVMCNNGERALGGVAVHPNFASNRYIYLYYTFKKNGTCNESEIDGPVNRLSRFVLPASNIIDPASEVVLFDTPPLYRDHHNSGDIAFGNDGYLYVTVGDGGARTLENAEGVSVPQDLGRLLGKIVRLTPTGAIPADNPFTPANGYPDSVRCNLDGVPPPGSPAGAQCQEIYAYGLRNPFRFAFDPNTSATRFFVNDVGQSTWEEISEGAIPGANYGWPAREGPCILKSTTECDPPTDSIDPIHWDIHGPDGGAITGGVFVPNGLWPPQFDNAYLYVSYVEGVIYQLISGGAGCRSCLPPTSDYIKSTFSASGEVVSMQFGPYGQTEALYYVTRGYGPTSLDGLRRIAYVGAANRAPTALATAAPSSGQAPLDVQFDGTGSSDPDGDPLSYAWDFDDDGSTDSTSPAPSYRYTNGGLYFASLTVNDGQNGEDTTTVRIDVDNMPPVPVIDSPANDATFAVGQVFTLRGTATDAEDGLLPDAALTWEVRQHHNSHYHPFLDVTTGNNIVLQPAPEPEDFEAAANSYLEVLLTATDSGGLSTTVSRDLLPRTVNLSFETTPPGLDLRIGGFTLTAPATVLSWEAHTLQIEAPDQTTESGAFYSWQSWSDGGAQSHTLVAPPAAAAYAATFQESAATSRTFAPTDDTYVRESRATRNYNVDPVVKVDVSSRKDGLLRFELSGIAGASIERVVLRLFVDNGSAFGGNFFKANNNNWDEATVTWATAPAADGGLLGSLA